MRRGFNMEEWKLFKLETPQQLLAVKGREHVLYFPCAGCDTEEPVIHGYTAKSPRWEDIQVVESRRQNAPYCLAFWCEDCFSKLEANSSEEEPPARGRPA